MIKTLDPEDPFLQKWNKIFLITCIVAVCLDPLHFYIPIVDPERLCISRDVKLAITLSVVRSAIDVFYAFRIFLKFRTGFIAPSSRVDGAGEVIKDSKAIMKRYFRSNFTVDILSIVPLPQLLLMVSTEINPAPVRALMILSVSQNIVRFLRVFPLFMKVTKTVERPWGGAAYNFCLYLLASHVIGSSWYLASFGRANSCWRVACGYNHCNLRGLYCDVADNPGSHSFLHSFCSPLPPFQSDYDYGIYHSALRIQLYKDLFRRFFYCFVWGLRNLSSLGQNLETSNDIGENLFVVMISITGLILFSVLTSNIQRYLQSLTVRVDEMSVKLREQEKWMSKIMLPEELRWRVRQHEQYKWQRNRGIDEESMICDLPEDLIRHIKRYQYMALLRRVPIFDKMDQQLIDALCCCLKRIFYTKGTIVFREGYPVDRLLFIKTGSILGEDAFFNYMRLNCGDFCGEELLTWATDPISSPTFPISRTTLQAVDDVEALSVMPDDLKRIVFQFKFLQSQQFEHNFRLNSQQLRSAAACTIQASWRRFRQRKMERSLNVLPMSNKLHC